MLGADFAISNCEERVHIDGLTLRAPLYDSLSRIVVLVSFGVTVVRDTLNVVLFIPDNRSSRPVDVVRPAHLITVVVVRKRTLAEMRGSVGLRPAVGVLPRVRGLLLRDGSLSRLDDKVELAL